MHIRLEQGIKGCQVITDTYKNDLANIQRVLNFSAYQGHSFSKTLILAPLNQGDCEDTILYQQLAQLVQAFGIRQLIGIGNIWKQYRAYFACVNLAIYETVSELLASGLLTAVEREVIAIKHSETENLLPLAQQLYQSCHSTVLEVDLDAIQNNLQFFRSKLHPNTQVLVMVKALAYGSSNYEVAKLLEHCQIDYLAVAYVDEGVALREHGISLPIMVTSPTPSSFHKLVRYQLEPVIYSLEALQSLDKFLLTVKASINIHLEVETGMYRLGFCKQDVEALIRALQATKTIRPQSIMTQLAAAGTPHHDAYTYQQVQLFQERAQQLDLALGIKLKKHILNTAGILRFPAYQFDMVRLGIGLYGVDIVPGLQHALKVASRLKATIIQIKQVPGKETVGYERKGQLMESRQIATLSLGYADGFSRQFGNGRGCVWIKGQLAPVVGHVCMDMVMVDITHIEAQPGDEAIIFGPELNIIEVAASIDTSPYELLTQVGERVRRVYYTSNAN
jgi:alanine racemase